MCIKLNATHEQDMIQLIGQRERESGWVEISRNSRQMWHRFSTPHAVSMICLRFHWVFEIYMLLCEMAWFPLCHACLFVSYPLWDMLAREHTPIIRASNIWWFWRRVLFWIKLFTSWDMCLLLFLNEPKICITTVQMIVPRNETDFTQPRAFSKN